MLKIVLWCFEADGVDMLSRQLMTFCGRGVLLLIADAVLRGRFLAIQCHLH